MKKILVFSTSTGAGHNQVAGALQNEYQNMGYEVEVVDFLKDASRFLDLLIAGSYNNVMIRAHFLYGILYHGSNNAAITRVVGFLMASILSSSLLRIIKSSQPELIIATHALALSSLADIKRRGGTSAPLISIITDFDAHSSYVNRAVDAYIAPSWHSKEMLVKAGIPKDKIFIYGIPIRREFLVHETPPAESPPFTILLMGGNAGPGAIIETVENLMQIPEPVKLLIVCGRNAVLKNKLDLAFPQSPAGKELVIFGFSDEIPRLMDAADIIITKPGGLTISEALAKRTPIVIPYCIAGQEEENARILAQCGVALRVEHIRNIGAMVRKLISEPKDLERMASDIDALTGQYSLDDMLEVGVRLMDEAGASRK